MKCAGTVRALSEGMKRETKTKKKPGLLFSFEKIRHLTDDKLQDIVGGYPTTCPDSGPGGTSCQITR